MILNLLFQNGQTPEELRLLDEKTDGKVASTGFKQLMIYWNEITRIYIVFAKHIL